MIYFLKGNVARKGSNTIVLNVHDVGYQLLVSHVEEFHLGEEVLVYTYDVVREDGQFLIGFTSLKEKNLFMSLIKVNGLGPKSVITALGGTDPETMLSAIQSNNIAYIKQLPGFGLKAASQILLDLKGKLFEGNEGDPSIYQDVKDALKSMGFKNAEVDRTLANINIPNGSVDQILKEALKSLNSKKK